MKGGEKRTKVVTRLRVVTITSAVKATSYRIEMKIAEPRIAPAPYVHHTVKR